MATFLDSGLDDLFNVTVRNKERINPNESTIYIANQVSIMDFWFIANQLPENTYMLSYKKFSDKFPIIKQFHNIVEFDTDNTYSLRKVLSLLKEGCSLLIFPEGRLTETGSLMKIREGISYIARKSNRPIQPIIINGTERLSTSQLSLNGYVTTKWFPNIDLFIGEKYSLPDANGTSFKELKHKDTLFVSDLLEKEVCNSRLKTNVNLFNEFLNSYELYGKERIIIGDEEEVLTMKDLLQSVYLLSNILNPMINDKQNVGILLSNSTTIPILLFSLFRLEKTTVMLNHSFEPLDIEHCCKITDTDCIITSRDFVEKNKIEIQQLEESYKVVYLEDLNDFVSLKEKVKYSYQTLKPKKVNSKENTIIFFDSNKPNSPKGIVLTHDQIWANVQQSRVALDFTPKDVLLNPIPFYDIFGLTTGLIFPILIGTTTYLYSNPANYVSFPHFAYKIGATVLLGTNISLQNYGEKADVYDFYELRYVLSGDKLSDTVRDLWQDKFRLTILEGITSKEGSTFLALNTPKKHKKGTSGRLLSGMEYQIQAIDDLQEEGALFVKGPNICKGYMDQRFIPTVEWYDTGYIARVDENGFISILD